jgi:hypothetical protein
MYRLAVIIDPQTSGIEVHARIQDPPALGFYLNGNLQITGVTADGRPVAYHKEPSTRIVIEADHPKQLSIDYAGCLKDTMSGVNLIRPDLVELAIYSDWFPIFEGGRLFDFELEADLPTGFIETTNGRLIDRRNHDQRTISSWKSFQPDFDIALVASPKFQKLEDSSPGMTVEVYSTRLSLDDVQEKKNRLIKAMARLAELYGPTQVDGQLRFVYSPRNGWSYSRVPLFVVSEAYALAMLKESFGKARDFHGAAHEAAHFWWGIAGMSGPDDWINEGLAEFSAFRLSTEQFGETFADTLAAEYRKHASACETDAAIAQTPNDSPDRYVNRYEKTTLLFLEAERRFGKEPLERFLKAFYTRFAGTRNATTGLFLQELNDRLGPEAKAFFEDALFRKNRVQSNGQTQ